MYTKCFPLWTSVFFFASPEACRKLYPFLSLPSVCDGSSWLMVELPANIWSFPAVSKLCTKVNCSNWNMEHVWSEYCATADTSSRVCLADSLMSNTTGEIDAVFFSPNRWHLPETKTVSRCSGHFNLAFHRILSRYFLWSMRCLVPISCVDQALAVILEPLLKRSFFLHSHIGTNPNNKQHEAHARMPR